MSVHSRRYLPSTAPERNERAQAKLVRGLDPMGISASLFPYFPHQYVNVNITTNI